MDTDLFHRWAKALDINYYHAASDLEAIARVIGADNAIEFAEIVLDTTPHLPLSQFAISKGYTPDFNNWQRQWNKKAAGDQPAA